MHTSEALLAEIEAFLARPEVALSRTAFGLLVLNDGNLVPTLRRGRRVWPETAARIRAFIQNHDNEKQRTE
jgi:hypothetical protein